MMGAPDTQSTYLERLEAAQVEEMVESGNVVIQLVPYGTYALIVTQWDQTRNCFVGHTDFTTELTDGGGDSHNCGGR